VGISSSKEDSFNKTGSSEQSPLISVGICTRDRADLLRSALHSISLQEYRNFEVVIADNCPSNDDAKKVAEQFNARYVLEPHLGHSWARNKLIAEASGEILAFMDDDMTVPPNWLSSVASGFKEPEVMSVTGLVLPAQLETPAQVIFEEAYGGYSNGSTPLRFGPGLPWKNGLYGLCHDIGPMMAFRRSIFEKVGPFDVALGVPVGGAEDIDMLHRVARTDCIMLYVPDAIRFHCHRRDLEGLRRQISGYGKAYTALLLKCFLLEPDLRRRILRRAVGYGFNAIAKPLALSLIGRGSRPAKLVIAEGIGALSGPWAYLRSVKKTRALDQSYDPGRLITDIARR